MEKLSPLQSPQEVEPKQDVLPFILHDIEEPAINKYLQQVMSMPIDKHNLATFLALLEHKNQLQLKNKTESDNKKEFEFAVQLLDKLDDGNINIISKIYEQILLLNPSSLSSKAEHFIQQILSEDQLEGSNEKCNKQLLFILKIVNGVLKAAMDNHCTICLQFYLLPLEKLAYHEDLQIQKYFLYDIIPKFVLVVIRYDIFARIWESLGTPRDPYVPLTILNYLSPYFIPINEVGCMFEVVEEPFFWKLVLKGLHASDSGCRKLCFGLLKMVIRYCYLFKEQFCVKIEKSIVFSWDNNNKDSLKEMWSNYFMLIETLDEKQSNIAANALNIYKSIEKIERFWWNYAFELGLFHSNYLIRLETIEKRLNYPITNSYEAAIILKALNEERIYRNLDFVSKVTEILSTPANIQFIYPVLAQQRWLAMPMFYMAKMLATLGSEAIAIFEEFDASVIVELLKNPCNSVPIRLGVKNQILTFICKVYDHTQWMNFLAVFSKLNFTVDENKIGYDKLKNWLSNCPKDDNMRMAAFLMNSYLFVDIVKLYLQINPNDKCFKTILEGKLQTSVDGFNLKDFLLVTHLLCDNLQSDGAILLRDMILNKYDDLKEYLHCVLTNANNIDVDDFEPFYRGCYNLVYATKGVGLLDDLAWNINDPVTANILYLLIVKSFIVAGQQQNVVNIPFLLDTKRYAIKRNLDDGMRRKVNKLYEYACEVLYLLISLKSNKDTNLNDIPEFLKHALNCGGYGCLKWILKTMTTLIPNSGCDLNEFIDKSWNEVLELKSNKQFLPCMKELINLITKEQLLCKPEYRDAIRMCSLKIMSQGLTSTGPPSLLVKRLTEVTLSKDSVLVPALLELLVYCPVVTEDQRSRNALVESFSLDLRDNVEAREEPLLPHEIRNMCASILIKIPDLETYQVIVNHLITTGKETMVKKPRYYQNSVSHHILTNVFMHLLFIVKITSNLDDVVEFCVKLSEYPHQNNIKFYLEWIMSLYLIMNFDSLPTDIEHKFNNMPDMYRLYALTFYIKHKRNVEDFNIVFGQILPFTMGPNFVLRLHAQYLIVQMYKNIKNVHNVELTIKSINTVLDSLTEENSLKELKRNYLANHFDPVYFLNSKFIYHDNLKLFSVDMPSSECLINSDKCEEILEKFGRVYKKMRCDHKPMTLQDWVEENKLLKENAKGCRKREEQRMEEEAIAFQKKYIPGEDNESEHDKKNMPKSDLIVVASLVDKLPNLGGMVRTSEVFGVKELILHSLKHMASKEFQGTSLSAEKLLRIKEVPIVKLKDYLHDIKELGYTIVAAEQTSKSVNLNTYKFPRKTVLVTGHEKEGLPPYLFPVVDQFVRIPQSGYTRSLNVHVTAAIFVWEYVRQHNLSEPRS